MTGQQLRNSILQLAIQGKLVAQDPKDEPASALLKRIEKERATLPGKRKSGPPSRIKRRPDGTFEVFPDGSEKDISDEIPFDIPESWEWSRIGSLFHLQAGKNIATNEISSESHTGLFPCFGGNGIRGYVKVFNRDGSFPLIGRQGALCGNLNMATGRFYATEHAVSVETFAEVDKIWTFYALKACDLNQYATATAQPGLAVSVVNRVLIPLPPLQEQQRIVAKIESLLPLVERYGRKEEELLQLNETLPKRLRQSLLQAAIEGKLVAQDPKEEPASALLERIAKERAALPGKRKAAPQSRIERRPGGIFELFPDGSEKDISDEIPFDIPESWEWSRFGEICINRDSERVPLSMLQRSKQAKIFDYYGASGVIDKVEKFIFEGRFLLIGEDGANLINRSTDIAFFAEGQFWVNNHAHVLSAYREMPLDFICSYINGISLTSFVSGTAQPKLTQAKLNSILVPIPPAREQHRIMQQLKKVLSIVNQS